MTAPGIARHLVPRHGLIVRAETASRLPRTPFGANDFAWLWARRAGPGHDATTASISPVVACVVVFFRFLSIGYGFPRRHDTKNKHHACAGGRGRACARHTCFLCRGVVALYLPIEKKEEKVTTGPRQGHDRACSGVVAVSWPGVVSAKPLENLEKGGFAHG